VSTVPEGKADVRFAVSGEEGREAGGQGEELVQFFFWRHTLER
jgi:hypothetical protein